MRRSCHECSLVAWPDGSTSARHGPEDPTLSIVTLVEHMRLRSRSHPLGLVFTAALCACIHRPARDVDAQAGGTQPAGLTVDVSNREASRAFFLSRYLPSDAVPSGWTGNVERRDPGATSAPFKDAVAARINYFRAMAGVPATIALDETYDREAQQAALMMSVRGGLSHAPDRNWPYYTDEGSDAAAHSNLDLGNTGAASITAYMMDDGDNNAAAGHRSWLLYPQTQVMGTGDVDKQSDQGWAANALWVIDGHGQDNRPPTRDGYVAWPPKGYVPHSLVFTRWSISSYLTDFSRASVTMTRDGASLPVTISGIGGNGSESVLVWSVSGFPSYPPVMPKPLVDVTFTVHIQGALIEGAPGDFIYTVVAFDPGIDAIVPPLGDPPGIPGLPTPAGWPTLPTNLPAPTWPPTL